MSDTFDKARPALVAAAKAAYERAYAPYSHFHVGAAVLTADGSVFGGCNVENASYGATVCAERNAVAAAVLAGHTELLGCVVYVGTVATAAPCGMCRQVLAEFGDDMPVVCVSPTGAMYETSLDALLPDRFSGRDIDGPRG